MDICPSSFKCLCFHSWIPGLVIWPWLQLSVSDNSTKTVNNPVGRRSVSLWYLKRIKWNYYLIFKKLCIYLEFFISLSLFSQLCVYREVDKSTQVYWVPATHVGERDQACGSWLWPQPPSCHCRHLKSSLSLWLSASWNKETKNRYTKVISNI